MAPNGKDMALPSGFTTEGLLPPGDYAVTLNELRASILVLGATEPMHCPHWDAAWRERLVDNFSVLFDQLHKVGITEVFIDGSFAEDKDRPSDIDGYFECPPDRIASGELVQSLNLLDPHKAWTWDPKARRAYPGQKLQLPMWHVYRVELYPHYSGLWAGQDAYGHMLEFPSFFRQRRSDGVAKGIVKVVRS